MQLEVKSYFELDRLLQNYRAIYKLHFLNEFSYFIIYVITFKLQIIVNQ